MYKAFFLILVVLPLISLSMDNEENEKKQLENHGSILGQLTQEDFKEEARLCMENNKEIWQKIIYQVKPDFNPDKDTITILSWGLSTWFESVFFLSRKAGSVDIRKCDWFEKSLANRVPRISVFGNHIEIDSNHCELEFFKNLPWMHKYPIKFAACAIGLTAISSGIFGYWLASRLKN